MRKTPIVKVAGNCQLSNNVSLTRLKLKDCVRRMCTWSYLKHTRGIKVRPKKVHSRHAGLLDNEVVLLKSCIEGYIRVPDAEIARSRATCVSLMYDLNVSWPAQ